MLTSRRAGVIASWGGILREIWLGLRDQEYGLMFFIIFFGTREVVRDADRPGVGGYQQCPNCGQYAQFRPRSARTWLHVFWLPVLPLGKARPLVECGNCRQRFGAPA